MSGRIRTIKPELLEDAKTATLDHDAWRLFVSLLLIADDHGNFRATPSLLEGLVFHSRAPREPLASLLATLADVGLILLYDAGGQKYGSIVNWKKHQKVDKPSKPRVPGPYDDVSTLSRGPREILARLPILTPTPTPTPTRSEEPPSALAPRAPDELSPVGSQHPEVQFFEADYRQRFNGPPLTPTERARAAEVIRRCAEAKTRWQDVLEFYQRGFEFSGHTVDWLAKNLREVLNKRTQKPKPADPAEKRQAVPGADASAQRIADQEREREAASTPEARAEARRALAAIQSKLGINISQTI